VRNIFALAVDDLVLVHGDFTTERLHGGVVSSLAPAASGDTIFLPAPIWFSSTSAGFAISSEGHVMRFTGTWARDTTFPGTLAAGLAVFSPTDLWTIADGAGIAHWNGSTWTVTALPSMPTGDAARALWGASTNDLWVASGTGALWRVTNGVPARFSTGLTGSDVPTTFWAIAGTGPSDVWFSGRHLNTRLSQYTLTLYHWDGVAFTRYSTLHSLVQLAMINGEVLAEGFDDDAGLMMWQYTGGHWIPRTDLDPAMVFPLLQFPSRPPFVGSIVSVPPIKPWWATGGPSLGLPVAGGAIWRHD